MEVTSGLSFSSYMKAVRQRTLGVLSEVPPERHAWRLSPDSMSVVDIILHIGAVEKSLWGGGRAAGKDLQLDSFEPDTLSYSEALQYLREVREASSAFWKTLTPQELNANITTPTGHSMRLSRWLLLAPEHEIHHRSFIHAYRKLWGLETHPIYGLTLDQLRNHLSNSGNIGQDS